jgi:hypothetical protein
LGRERWRAINIQTSTPTTTSTNRYFIATSSGAAAEQHFDHKT